MVIIFGTYRFFRRIVGFRNDFCLNCARPQVALQLRAFWCFSLFWIPVLPLGFWKTWHCSVCEVDPHARTRISSRLIRWAVVALLLIFALAMWMDPIDPEAQGVSWALRMILPLAIVAAIRWAIVVKPEPRLREELARLLPFTSSTCPVCGGELLRGSTTMCGKCDAILHDLIAPERSTDG